MELFKICKNLKIKNINKQLQLCNYYEIILHLGLKNLKIKKKKKKTNLKYPLYYFNFF